LSRARRQSQADELLRRAAAMPGSISFAGGLPDPTRFPKLELSRAFLTTLRRHADTALQYGWPEGDLELRREIVKMLAARGAKVSHERVIVTSGAQQALSIAVNAAPRRRSIAVEPESYPGALDVFRALGAELAPASARADLQYVMPSVGNPRGLRMDDAQRRDVLARASGHRYIVEDDAYDGTDFAQESTEPLLALAPDRVFHVGTFSKTLSPGLRVGWLVVPTRWHQRALSRKQRQDLQASSLSQALLVEYLRSGHFEEHRRRSVAAYRAKLGRLSRAVGRALPELSFQLPVGGFSLWLESERAIDDLALLKEAVKAKVSFDPGSSFRVRPSTKLAFRLCFSAVPSGSIEEGVARLARALARVKAR
jgi:2-aminoadipate transaminase